MAFLSPVPEQPNSGFIEVSWSQSNLDSFSVVTDLPESILPAVTLQCLHLCQEEANHLP